MATEKTNKTDKLQEHLDLQGFLELNPKTLIFQRTKSDGNYGSIKVGGEYEIPEGMTRQEAMKLIVNNTQQEVSEYLAALRDRTSRQWSDDELHDSLVEVEEELQRFDQRLDDEEHTESKIEKGLVEAQLYKIQSLLSNFYRIDRRLNQEVDRLIRKKDEIIRNTGYDSSDFQNILIEEKSFETIPTDEIQLVEYYLDNIQNTLANMEYDTREETEKFQDEIKKSDLTPDDFSMYFSSIRNKIKNASNEFIILKKIINILNEIKASTVADNNENSDTEN